MAEINVNEIIVKDRIRQNNGWLDSLERSIEQVGVLQPIGITPDKQLIFGGRRLQACKNLGLKTIPVRIFDIAADDPITALRMEREENEHRMDLTVSEKVEIAKRIEEAMDGRRGGDRGNQYTGGKVQNFASCQPQVNPLRLPPKLLI
jgi:ParB family chromosome partitioning protein